MFGWSERTARGAARVPMTAATVEHEWLEGGITAVPGILAGGVVAGIKPSGKKDLALIYILDSGRTPRGVHLESGEGCSGARVREHVRGGQAQAIVASSGCANVCTG